MRTLVIGATGLVGGAAADALEAYGDEVLRASQSSALAVDVLDASSVAALLDRVTTDGPLDAVVCAVGSVPFKPLADLGAEDYLAAYRGKVASQVDVTRLATPHLVDAGSITLTTGVLAREPIRTGAAAALANGAVESFVVSAAAELPRGLRINAVSPTVLVEATGYHPFFPGFAQVSAAEVGQAFVKAVHGVQTGQVHALDGR
ncbi:short chain dehydrogenase [Microlunatus flavus]|uniref:Enoyl-(Acyl carrier protein) reductase n=1 Tax=Microlunatus flavus TaxID=1036181 RepID=A0A1H9HD18_9ACTN|nr:short chain dehydrogenase [Microlunatus flavus]SEQ60255.1 Enoyl-(Acyl carrier protein) reductase [Microlunatus flavus]